MTERPRSLQPTVVIILSSLVFAGLFWVADSIYEYYRFSANLRFMLYQEPLTLTDSLLLNVPPYALFDRLVVTFTCLVGGALVALYLAKYRQRDAALRESQERLRHAEKMQAIGQLAGGIAHDFNNQLGGILGYAELLEKELEDKKLAEYANTILLSAQRAADLTQKLLAFSRKGDRVAVTLDLHELVDEAIALLGRSIDKRIKIRKALRADPSILEGDPALLQSAILNLAINSRDAMPEGGVLSLQTERVHVPAGDADDSTASLPHGEYLALTVSDTGSGMSREVQRRMFEPFFTTKEPGRGTGMGLAAVYGTVESHRGAIRVTSGPEKGTQIRVLLPATTASAVQEKSAEDGPLPAHRSRILVVDDEPAVRDLTAEMLQGLGHQVVAVSSGREAIDLYTADPARFDIVVLDLVLPGIGGGQVFREIRRLDPDARVVLISGHSARGEISQLIEEGAAAFVQKPFRTHELANAVVAALDR